MSCVVTSEDLNILIFIGLLCEKLLQLRAEIFPWSKDMFPHWNSLCVGDPSADFRQSNQLTIQPEEIKIPYSVITR